MCQHQLVPSKWFGQKLWSDSTIHKLFCHHECRKIQRNKNLYINILLKNIFFLIFHVDVQHIFNAWFTLFGVKFFLRCMILKITDILSYVQLETYLLTPRCLHVVDFYGFLWPISDLEPTVLSSKLYKH